jgi:hypothetical protein
VNCSGAHESADRCPVFLDETAIQNFVSRTVFPLDALKKFLENEPKTGTQSYASALRRPQVTDAATQTKALNGFLTRLPELQSLIQYRNPAII